MTIINIKNRNTEKEEEFESFRSSSNSLLYLKSNHLENETAKNIESQIDNFSIDLTLGTAWNHNYSYSDRSLYMIDKEITLKPRQSVVVTIGETMKIPNNIFGIVVSTGSLFLQHGVLIPTAKIEPGFTGLLKLRIVNTSKKKITIPSKMKIASAIFFDCETTPLMAIVPHSDEINPPKYSWKNKIYGSVIDTITNPSFLSIIGIIVAIIAIFYK